MIIYNAHTHIFTSNYVPEYVVGQDKIPWIGKKLNISNVSRLNKKFLGWLRRSSTGFHKVNRILTFAEIGLGATQEDTLNRLEDYYTNWGDLRIVVLTMDMECMGAGIVRSNYWTQLDELIMLRTKGNYRNILLPFFCVDPRRKEYTDGKVLLEIVKRYFEKHGFVGIKLYPALGYYPFDEKLYPLYKWCEENYVPIMTHCIEGVIYFRGDTGSLPPVNCSDYVEDNTSKKNEIFQRNFTQPHNFEILLKDFPKLKVCFGHYGGYEEMIKQNGWTEKINTLIEKYDNVYTDVSFIIENNKTFPLIKKAMSDSKLGNKIMFGTDYFVVSKNKLEDKLAMDFRVYMMENGAGSQFFNSATTVVKNYLTSNFYIAP